MEGHQPDWDPMSAEVLRDPLAAYDLMRERQPVAYSERFHWSLFRHEDVVRVLRDHETFSNAVSQHLSVPNGMDPPEHSTYRRIIEPYFRPELMDAFRPTCQQIAADLVEQALEMGEVEIVGDCGRPFAVRVQCAFLGWPATLAEPLIQWTLRSHVATLAQDRPALSALAREFEEIIDNQLDSRASATDPAADLTVSLMNEHVGGRPLSSEEIASILRNWTVGEIATISASIGILVHFLATNGELQRQLRSQPARLPAAIDEILRIHGPLSLNRRVATRPVEIGGRRIEAGEQVSIMWQAANRDGRVFPEPEKFRWDRDPKLNLLYGDGIHVCPGAPLARLEMVSFLQELLSRTAEMALVPGKPPTPAVYPACGFDEAPIRFR